MRGIVLEAFGVGNMPDLPKQGWLPWLKKCVKQGIKVPASPRLSSDSCMNPRTLQSHAVWETPSHCYVEGVRIGRCMCVH